MNALSHRRGSVDLVVSGANGEPLTGRTVVVEQVRQDFAFGNIGFDLVAHANEEEDLSDLAADWLSIFNTATLPFYWGRFEPLRGRPDTVRLHRAASWFASHGVSIKGHPLVWHTVKPAWLDHVPLDQVERLLRERVRREVSDFSDVIQTWDAINEVVIMPDFTNEPDGIQNAVSRLAQSVGRIEMVRLAFDEARGANATTTLLLNDFDLSEDYERLIEESLAAGVAIDALGLQTHMHQGYWGEATMLEMVDRFARFGLPLHFTETTLVSGDPMPADIVDLNDYQPAHWPSTAGGEARQADEIVRHYRSLFGHPAVEAITYWGITDAGAWLGAPGGIIRSDGSHKPAFGALRSLIRDEWWTPPVELRADDAGRIRIEGLRGDYRLTVDGRSANFRLDREAELRYVGYNNISIQ